jgi:hypothetical protein
MRCVLVQTSPLSSGFVSANPPKSGQEASQLAKRTPGIKSEFDEILPAVGFAGLESEREKRMSKKKRVNASVCSFLFAWHNRG